MPSKGKTAIITGGATVIGEAVSKKFSSLGAKVVVVGLADDPVDEVVQETKEAPPGMMTLISMAITVAYFYSTANWFDITKVPATSKNKFSRNREPFYFFGTT